MVHIYRRFWDSLPKSVKNEIDTTMENFKYIYAYQLSKCESPIEQMLLFHILIWVQTEAPDINTIDKNLFINIEPQKEVSIADDKYYRVDILITVTFLNKTTRIVIECDGHDFHEKTKEQAVRDKKRDRDLLNEGYQVIHFTGSEIYKNANKCAMQVKQLVEKLSGIEEYFEDLIKKDGVIYE